MLQKVLIANRGEIALRIVRACRDLGVASVAVYSDVDRHALHVRAADEAYRLGEAPAAASYLRGDRIVELALACGADAIHPGYGFLAENPRFTEMVEGAGLIYIGPTARSQRLLGDKVAARRLADECGVPRVPGSAGAVANEVEALEIARGVGYPLLLKAAAGGGGRGMRLVHTANELPAAFRSASSEAASAFGDGTVFLERAIMPGRHVEVQVVGDGQGAVLHFGERECTLQRRHQKLIEEAPASCLDDEQRARLHATAVRLAGAARYRSAGTLEFIVDGAGDFYFLEMNTRLQVEHPVTELVTGVDLARQQLLLASGLPMDMCQEDIRVSGHAIECRILAEDPARGFMPASGVVSSLVEPSGPGIRMDSGAYAGMEVSVYYDSMIAKLIGWGRTREECTQRLCRALDEYVIGGLATTIPFYQRLLRTREFRDADFDIEFIGRYVKDSPRLTLNSDDDETAAAVLAAIFMQARSGVTPVGEGAGDRAMSSASAWALAGRPGRARW